MVETKLAHHLSLYNSFSHKRMLLKEQKEKSNGVKEVCRGNFTRIYLYKEDRPTQLLCLSNAEWCKTYGRKIVWCTVFFWPKLLDAQVFRPKARGWVRLVWGLVEGRVGSEGEGCYQQHTVLQCISMPEHNERYFKRILQKKWVRIESWHSTCTQPY